VKTFRYERPTDPAAAVTLAAGTPGARYLAGGTNLVDLMKLGVETPELLIDVSRLPLGEVEETHAGGLRIGAAVRGSRLAAHPLVRQRYPVLPQALLSGASAQLRNAATIGGNLLQRTRCLYFQDVSKPCNKRRPGSGCPAREGVHRDLAVLGASEHCIATHTSDLAVALAALDATVHLTSPAGARSLPLTDLYRLPGEEPERDTVLRHGELITSVELPPPPLPPQDGRSPSARSRTPLMAYRKVRDRASYAFALVSVAAVLEVRDAAVHEVRLAFGGLAAKPWRAYEAERALRGRPADEESFTEAVHTELSACRPLRDNGYKPALAQQLAVAVLAGLAGLR
jgi:xanthine dehydrogenase YagS FAD-binding subunit